MPRPRKRAAGLMLGAAVLFLLATNVQSGWLYVYSALLLGALVAGWIMPVVGLRGLRVDRVAPDRVHQGDEVVVDVIASNRGRGARRGALVHDPNLDPIDLWLGTIRPGERVAVTTVRTASRRGVHEPRSLTLRTGAPFGVAVRRKTIAPGPRASATLVLPTVVPLGPLPFIEPTATSDHAIHSLPRRGQGPEYLGVREYRAGDSMRHVHWPSTARTGAVMVREFEQEQTRRLAVIVDASRDEGESWTPLDRVCCAAASVASAALAQGNGARLITPAGGQADADSGAGADVLSRAAEEQILDRLATLSPEGGPFPAMLDGLADGPDLRGVETAVLVFPTWAVNDAEALPPVVERLAERILHVVALPVIVKRRGSGDGHLDEAGMAGLQQRLRAAGATVYPWPVEGDLATVLAAGRMRP